jgi:hypothetical protein
MDFVPDFVHGCPLIRQVPGQHLVKHGAEGIDIAPNILGLAGGDRR